VSDAPELGIQTKAPFSPNIARSKLNAGNGFSDHLGRNPGLDPAHDTHAEAEHQIMGAEKGMGEGLRCSSRIGGRRRAAGG
jgi:hypothetical protein